MKKSVNKTVIKAILISSIFFGGYANSESVRHFEGESADSYAEALDLLKNYNKELAKILNKESPEVSELGNIHRLTYTLENALNKMRSEIHLTSEVLEKLHKASEGTDMEKAKKLGQSYLEASNKLITVEH